MAGSLNRVTLIGNLGADPDVRHTQSNQKIVTLSIATSESWRDKNSGERRERTEWHRVVIFPQGLAEIAEKYLTKGSKVMVEGKMRTRKWQDQAGQDRYSTEVALEAFDGKLILLGKNGNGNGSAAPAEQGMPPADAPATSYDPDDEIPF